ncbi:FtsH protease activity modulator HflK [Endozoicomonadaceae bacterium StTr2]
MAWNEPGGNNQDPWGGGNRGNGGRGNKNQGPPDLDDAFRKVQDKLNGFLGGGKGDSSGGKGSSSGNAGGGSLFVGILLIACIVYLWNAFYTVDEKERAVILTFGKYTETVGPGLHIYFPPLQSKYQENVTELRTYNLKQQMLTEDENIVEVSMSVQYKIADIKQYVLEVAQPLKSLEEATQSALRHVVGSSEMHQVLTEGRELLSVEVKDRLQTYLNSYGTGLEISKINVESAQPPREVQSSFDDVIRAREDEERAKNKAEAYANRIVPEARGKAQRIIEEANGYRETIVAQAQGDADRFTKLLSEYHRAPEVTRERLYLETMEEVLGSTSKVLVDVEGGNNMMYLPLDKLMEKQSGTDSASGRNEMSSQELNELAGKVADELSRRVNSARSGRTSR